MPSFFKTFFASLFAMVVFSLLVLLVMVLFIGGITSKTKTRVDNKSVIVLNLSQHFSEQVQENPLSVLNTEGEADVPGLYDVVRLLHKAGTDKRIAGIYIIANENANGFAASEEIRNALLEFKKTGKFIIAHGDMISQKAYGIANTADKIYVSPQGMMEWAGFSVDYAFIKGTLEKLEIHPQIFYAGKFKSATEPLRTDRMTEENKLQTTVFLNDLYDNFLLGTSITRKIDTATLRALANNGSIRNVQDAVSNHLLDGIKYDDEVRDEIRSKLSLTKEAHLNLLPISSYRKSGNYSKLSGERIALIYAEGDIVDGKAEIGVISSENYRNVIRKARLDKSIKAIVFRVNSGGGSSLASESIWRELALAKKDKPVVVSFGDVAASGGYYISCAADSIFCQPVTITGSIGVFGIIPNMQDFFKNKIGITFDGVQTGPYADALSVIHPLTPVQQSIVQEQINRTYSVFKQRVAEGRRKDTVYIDSIAQGRVWTGKRAKEIGLVDRFGGIDDALACAARMAKTKDYRVIELPEPINLFDRILGKANPLGFSDEKIKKDIGEEPYRIYQTMKKVKELCNSTQARLPFDFAIH
jgi:protease-4